MGKTKSKPGRKPGPKKVKRLVSLDAEIDELVGQEAAKQGFQTEAAWIAWAVTKKFRTNPRKA